MQGCGIQDRVFVLKIPIKACGLSCAFYEQQQSPPQGSCNLAEPKVCAQKWLGDVGGVLLRLHRSCCLVERRFTMEVITPFKLQSTSEIFWSRSLAAAKSASEPGFSFLHDNQTMPALAGLQGSVITRQIQAAQVGDVDAVREVAVGGQGTKLLVLKKCSEGSIMVKKNKVLTWKERNKRFEDVDSGPDIVAIEKVRRNIHSIPYILQQQLPSIANCQLAW